MTTRRVLLLNFLIVVTVKSQSFWSPPVQITSGTYDDVHPSFGSSSFFSSDPQEEWLAFTRLGSNGSKICVMQTQQHGLAWVDTVYDITNDSTINDLASLARYCPYSSAERTMLVWQKGESNSDIYYSYNLGGVWSPPAPITIDHDHNRTPNLAQGDSVFGAVWERKGRIMFAEFRDGSWTPPVTVTPVMDSSNFFPQIRYPASYGNSRFRPVIVWEKVKLPDTSRAVLYTVGLDSSWSTPDTIAWSGDNRNPKFIKLEFPSLFHVSWESKGTGDWEVYGSGAYIQSFPFSISWIYRNWNITSNPGVDERNGCFATVSEITDQNIPSIFFPYAYGCWEKTSGLSDSIMVSRGDYQLQTSFGTLDGATNHHPDISCGLGWFTRRVWLVWENSVSGHSKLYGSTAEVAVVSVGDEGPSRPESYVLLQNYPNPFNPSTMINYQLATSGLVTLKVFDVLGREVGTLVNEKKEVGDHHVSFNGAGLPSGVYFYRLVVDKFATTRKMVLLK
jgi:hypothetical protein